MIRLHALRAHTSRLKAACPLEIVSNALLGSIAMAQPWSNPLDSVLLGSIAAVAASRPRHLMIRSHCSTRLVRQARIAQKGRILPGFVATGRTRTQRRTQLASNAQQGTTALDLARYSLRFAPRAGTAKAGKE